MAATLIDARPSEVIVKFLKGAAMSTTFYYLDSNNQAVDLSAYRAEIEVVDAITGEPDLVWTRELPLVIGEALVDGVVIPGCSGVQMNYSTLDTEVAWDSAKFICNLISPDNVVDSFLYGTFTPINLV